MLRRGQRLVGTGQRGVGTASGSQQNTEFGDWCAVYINLARRGDRRANLARTLSAANSYLLTRIERIEAVDGQHISLEDDDLHLVVSEKALLKAQRAKAMQAVTIVHREGQLVRFHDHLTEGGVACALSHHAALEAVASHPTARWGLILEDDVCGVVPRVHKAIDSVLHHLPSNWDAVFLGYHGGSLAGTEPGSEASAEEHARAELELQIDNMRGPTDGFVGAVDDLSARSTTACNVPLLRMYMPLYGLYAWMVRKEAAQAALEGAFPIDGQVDYALSHWLVRERGRCFRVAPRHLLFFSPKSEDALDSDVQSMTTLEGLLENPEACERYLRFVQSEEGMDNGATALLSEGITVDSTGIAPFREGC